MKCAFIALICAALAAAQGCRKGDTPSGVPPQVSLLTSGTWKLTSLEFESLNGTWTTVAVQGSQAAETVSFSLDNTYASVSGAGTVRGTWQFSSDYTQLTLVNQATGQVQTPLVTALSPASLQLLWYVARTVNGTSYYAERDTFGH